MKTLTPEQIKARLQEVGMTQKELAEQLGLDPARLSEMINCKREMPVHIETTILTSLMIPERSKIKGDPVGGALVKIYGVDAIEKMSDEEFQQAVEKVGRHVIQGVPFKDDFVADPDELLRPKGEKEIEDYLQRRKDQTYSDKADDADNPSDIQRIENTTIQRCIDLVKSRIDKPYRINPHRRSEAEEIIKALEGLKL